MKTLAIGLKRHRQGKTLDVWFPIMISSPSESFLERFSFDETQSFSQIQLTEDLVTQLSEVTDSGHIRISEFMTQVVNDGVAAHGYDAFGRWNNGYADITLIAAVLNDSSKSVTSAEEAYFKLHMLSYRLVRPHGVCMDGVFGKLTNVAWTSKGPMLPEDVAQERLHTFFSNTPLQVTHVDKFPYLVNYIIPSGVRIASGSRVRLGAYLGEGTTVMPVGYINFNAGTEGPSMVEGRVSAGVFVAKNSDLGGSSSVMGTLSGGNQHVISIGENCLIGANAGTGISLGNYCTIAAGLYVYAGKKVSLYNHEGHAVNLEGKPVREGENIVKARELSGRDNLLFIEDSQTGKLVCKPNHAEFVLNDALHQNA